MVGIGMKIGPPTLCPESFVDMLVVPKVRWSTARVQQDFAEITNGAWLDFRLFWPLYAFGFTHMHMHPLHRSFAPSYMSSA